MDKIIVGPWPVIQIAGLSLPTYYIILSFVLTLTTWFVYKRAEKKQYSGTTALDLYLVSTISGVVGARLMHIFYEDPQYYLEHPLEVFYFWQGGFVFYGGAIAAFISGLIALKIKKQSFPMWLDFFAPVASIGYALGRIACFFAGCCYGKSCDLPWAFPFKEVDLVTNATRSVYLHPTQLYASALELMIFVFLLYIERLKTVTQSPGRLFTLWIGLHALSRLAMEYFRADDRGPLMGGFSISTRISLFILVAIAFYLRNSHRRHKVP